MTKPSPAFIDRRLLDRTASLSEEDVSLDEKFCYLIDNNIKKLIRPSIEEDWFKSKNDKEARKKLNGIFRNIAINTLRELEFKKDILKLAEKAWLSTTRYEVKKDDFYVGTQSSAIRAYYHRLQYLSNIFLSKKVKSVSGEIDIAHLFVKTYLPPKVDADIYKLMSKYHLGFYWYESIAHLLLNGIWWLPRHSSVICINLVDWDKAKSRHGEITMDLKISSLTDREEIFSRWNEIESLKAEIFPKTKMRKRARNLDDIYSTMKDGSDKVTIESLAEKGSRGKKEKHTLKVNTLKKRLARAESDRADELKAIAKHIPKRIWNQVKGLEDWSLQSIYYY